MKRKLNLQNGTSDSNSAYESKSRYGNLIKAKNVLNTNIKFDKWTCGDIIFNRFLT